MSSAPRALRSAIVTGASSGIGAATALEMGRRGYRVALGARRVVPGMIARRLGDVVFVGSDSAQRPRTFQGASPVPSCARSRRRSRSRTPPSSRCSPAAAGRSARSE